MLIVSLGNTAVTTAVAEPCSEDEAVNAGPLGQKWVDEDGQESYAILRQVAHPLGETVTVFNDQGEVANGYKLSSFIRDISLAYGSQHSFAPPSWVHCNDAGVAHLVALELAAGAPIPELAEVPADAGPGYAGTATTEADLEVD